MTGVAGGAPVGDAAPAGLTARAKPEARPDKRAANLQQTGYYQEVPMSLWRAKWQAVTLDEHGEPC